MEMNDILNGLNSCDEEPSGCNDCGNGNSNATAGLPTNLGNGSGFNAWIWILLILFYCCNGSGVLGANNNNNNNTGNCCCCDPCCCNSRNTNGSWWNGGMLGNCSSYLFLLVILFLCNGLNRGCGCSDGLTDAANFGC